MPDSPERPQMQMHRPAFKYEINVTTILALAMFVITIGGIVMQHGRFTQRVDQWISAHEELHKSRLADTTASYARMDERMKAMEAESRSLENIRYRLTVQEQGATSLARTVDELRQAIAQQNSDIRLIREIVTRLDPGPSRK